MLRDWKVYPGSQSHLVNGFLEHTSSSFQPYYWYLGEEALTTEKHMGRKATDMLVLAWGEPELAQNCLLHLCLKSERSHGYVARYSRIICDSHTVPQLLNLEMSPDNGTASSTPVTFMYSTAGTQPREADRDKRSRVQMTLWHRFTWMGAMPQSQCDVGDAATLLTIGILQSKGHHHVTVSCVLIHLVLNWGEGKFISVLEEETWCAVLFNIC